MYVCTYGRMYVCTYVRMYVCMYVRMYVSHVRPRQVSDRIDTCIEQNSIDNIKDCLRFRE